MRDLPTIDLQSFATQHHAAGCMLFHCRWRDPQAATFALKAEVLLISRKVFWHVPIWCCVECSWEQSIRFEPPCVWIFIPWWLRRPFSLVFFRQLTRGSAAVLCFFLLLLCTAIYSQWAVGCMARSLQCSHRLLLSRRECPVAFVKLCSPKVSKVQVLQLIEHTLRSRKQVEKERMCSCEHLTFDTKTWNWEVQTFFNLSLLLSERSIIAIFALSV